MGTLLALDLAVFHRHAHAPTLREAARWSVFIIAVSLAFGGFVWWQLGPQRALEYYTGFLVEKALSVDNLFVFILLFRYFAVPAGAQPTVLKWGIFGAMLMRGVMIGVGALLLHEFEWIIWVFGAIIVVTGLRMFRESEERIEPEHNPLVRLARRYLPFANAYDGDRFTLRTTDGRRLFTPLLLVVLIVEWTDLVFAIDSIPAVFAITDDPFIVYSSNIFAILGLRALFFLLAGMLERFTLLKPAVAGILVFIGAKMLAAQWITVPTGLSLALIATTLTGAVTLSLLRERRAA
ncbi:MAG: TerC family protein [Gemmatimonadales bacterium]|nr:TerC family protein [Gemmatimonadales bacterium]